LERGYNQIHILIMGRFSKKAIEKRRAQRRMEAAKHMPTGEQAIKNALQKGYITLDELADYRKQQEQKKANKKIVMPKRKPRIIYGLNTNSM
jgi:hypothetical protein